ncbi:hypothetical protein CQY22_002580 [Mycolicibacterium brumae]|uniref:Uncharacterized protein n=1 Tax=Mycolicibacterium brumae TaxID=85968 RepID=A0A2G5PG47_9MYCO|nr:hypothetical protein CQY22_002580 [Mycolicibacterium brumae]
MRSRLAQIERELRAPLRVAVDGRAGVGRATVAQALAAGDLEVVAGDAELRVRVLAEVVKPEDRADAAPDLLVWNKADLSGVRGGGPVALAMRRCAELTAATGLPAEPMVALVALGADALDAPMLDALTTLAGDPADLRTPDGFLAGPHRVPATVRARLLETLDMFGIAHAVVAMRAGEDADGVRVALRAASRVDEVLAAAHAAAAPAYFRRAQAAVWGLRALALGDAGLSDAVAGWLAGPAALAGLRAVAAAVLRADVGAGGPTGGLPGGPLERARHWQAYAAGPVDELRRACAAELVRAELAAHAAGLP